MTIKEKTKLYFYATCCNDCFFYCDGEGFGDPYCNQDELRKRGSKNFMYVRLSKMKVPDDCPARDNSTNKYLKKIKGILRKDAIDRIKKISNYIAARDYKSLSVINPEQEGSIIVNCIEDSQFNVDISDIDTWTDKMLEDALSLPLYCFSVFDTYLIVED